VEHNPKRFTVCAKTTDTLEFALDYDSIASKTEFLDECSEAAAPVVCTDHAGAASAVVMAVREKPNAFFYVCGSGRFMNGMFELLSAAGVPKNMIRAESFH